MRACIQSLPAEILRHIFCIGCNDKSEIPLRKCIARKRKPFIHLARQICSEWRDVSDRPANPHFWIAHLFLEISDEDAEPLEPRYHTDRPFVQRLINFRNCLTTSEGCDLNISISLPGFEWDHGFKSKWSRNATEISPDAVLALRLLFHGMQLVVPYQTQVTSIGMQGYVPLAWGRFILMIITEFRNAYILEEIRLSPGLNYACDIPQSTSEVLSLPETVGFRHQSLHSTNQIHLPFTTDHLPRLNRLTLPYPSWLNIKELKLNSSISHLEISRCSPPDLLIELLGTQLDLLKNLITLSIGYDRYDRFEDEYKNTSSHPPSLITLPRLMSISLESVHSSWANFFFKCTRAPILERVSLDFIHEKEDISILSMTEEMEYPNSKAAVGPTSLLALSISTEISWSSLKLFKNLSNPSIEKLHLWIHMPHDHTLPNEDLLSQMAEVISCLKPCSLHLRWSSYQTIQYVLNCINLQQVQCLGVEIYRDSANSRFNALIGRLLSYRKPTITLPSLTDIKFHVGDLNIFPRFLRSISAYRLQRVSLSIKSKYTVLEGNQDGDSRSTSFPLLLSVKIFELTICEPVPPDIWKLTPNVRSLTINIKKLAPDFATRPMECINLIVGLFRPDENHAPLLLHLQTFSLRCAIQSPEVNLQELFQSISSYGRLYKIIKRVLFTREEFGATPLKLKTIRLVKIHEEENLNRDLLIEIVAEA